MKKTVILVDDDDLVRAAYSRLLAKKLPHLEIATASSVDDGFAKVKAIGLRLVLVITDFQLADRKGSELLAMLDAEGDHTSRVPRIVMSGITEDHARRYHGHIGRFHAWLVKPADLDEMITTVESLIG